MWKLTNDRAGLRHRWLIRVTAAAVLSAVCAISLLPLTGCSTTDGDVKPSASLGSASAPWKLAVPSAYMSVSSLLGEDVRQRGVVLATHWRAKDGSVVETTPDGSVVWPHSLPQSGPPVLRFWIEATRLPVRVDLRIFDGPVDAAGVPVGTFTLLECQEQPHPQAPCQFGLDRGGVTADYPKPSGRLATLVVLYAEWFVPVRERSAAAGSDPVVSASWGFRLASSDD